MSAILNAPTTTGTPPTFTTDGSGHIVAWSTNGQSTTDTTEEVTIEWPMIDITSKAAVLAALLNRAPDAFTSLNADSEALGDDWYLAGRPAVIMDTPDRRSFTCRATFTNTTKALRLYPYEDRSIAAYTSFKSGSRTETRAVYKNAKTAPTLTADNGRLSYAKNIYDRYDGTENVTTLLGADGQPASGDIMTWPANESKANIVDSNGTVVDRFVWTKYFDAAAGTSAKAHVQQTIENATETPKAPSGRSGKTYRDAPGSNMRPVFGYALWRAIKVYDVITTNPV